jgi:hypothetical protein
MNSTDRIKSYFIPNLKLPGNDLFCISINL